MKNFVYFTIISLSAILNLHFYNAASAQEKNAAETSTIGDTRIEVDDEKDMIRFFIKGEETMRLDDLGLHVKYQLNYGTNLVDVGPYVFPAARGDTDNEK